MALSKSSTQSDALGQYLDNLSWDGDISKAKLALEAIRYLIMTRPEEETTLKGISKTWTELKQEKESLENFVASGADLDDRSTFVEGIAVVF